MKIETKKFKELVNTAIQGVSNNKIIPITQLMSISVDDDGLCIITTDATNYLYVFDDVEDKTPFSVTVFAEQFAKLIGRITSENVELTIADNALQVIGNGDYMLELPLDEEGELITYPDPYADIADDIEWTGKIKSSVVKNIIDSVKPSLANSMEMPAITNYYVGNKVVATDRYKIATLGVNLFNSDKLVSARLMDLINLLDGDIDCYIDDSCMLFGSDKITIYSKSADDVDSFPITVVDKFVAQDFKSVCKISKIDFIALLERISLFVGKYDDKAIRLYFEKNGLRVCNKNRKSNEVIEYVSAKKHKDYDCIIDVDMLLTQLKAYSGDVVELHYNNDNAIKFVDGDLIQIVALMEN